MKKNSINTTIIFKELSIQIAMNGLSFAIRNSANDILTVKTFSFEKIYTELALVEAVKNTLNNEKVLHEKFDKISVTHSNNNITFVPNALFQTTNLADYLKFSISLEQQQNIVYDNIDNLSIKAVYIPFGIINNLLFERYGDFESSHHAVKLLDYFQAKNELNNTKTCYLYLKKDSFDCFILENTKLVFYNNFTYQNTADILYFLLFTFEQFNLNQEKNPIYYCGQIANTEILIELKKYFNKMTLIENTLKAINMTEQRYLQEIAPIL